MKNPVNLNNIGICTYKYSKQGHFLDRNFIKMIKSEFMP